MIAAVACCAPAQLTGELAGDPAVGPLIERFLRTSRYDPPLAFDLVALARGETGASWALRRLAVLMLEHQALGLSPDDDAQVVALLQSLGVAGEPRPIFLELTRRLGRLLRVHRGIAGADTSDAALARFVDASRSECKLTLGRYLFTPSEVVQRIVTSFTTSTGVRDGAGLGQPFVREELARSLDRLPPYEAAIVRGLSRQPTVYWVSPDTGSRINGLVEYPHDTVVAVIKPPGSDQEFEIKRVGLRQPEPLHAVFDRNGGDVPATHRIQGGSMAYYLRWEAAAAASLAHVHRRIHGDEAPISRTTAMSTIYGVPCGGGERHIVDYFARVAGPSGREDTRRAMRASIQAFCREMRSRSLPARTDFELGAQFLGQVAPTQSVLIGTSSFRLDRIGGYLSPAGADHYFAQMSPAPTAAECQAFADEVLEEILGVLSPVDTPFDTHTQYVDAAFADADNRARADRYYLATMRQLGAFWGALMGMRAFTYGESFVARNVGLRSVWAGGEWTPTLVFLDHDATYLSGVRSRQFHPLSALPGMRGDHMHVWGFGTVKGSSEWLRILYRVDDDRAREGEIALRDEMRRAFDRAGRAIREDVHVQRCFHAEFVDRFADWDVLASEYVHLEKTPAARAAWASAASARLEALRYPDNLRREHLSAFDRYGAFVESCGFLYGAPTASCGR
jgi:hypothetical protein